MIVVTVVTMEVGIEILIATGLLTMEEIETGAMTVNEIGVEVVGTTTPRGAIAVEITPLTVNVPRLIDTLRTAQ